eukprot:2221119-Rhodomonas_salina.1
MVPPASSVRLRYAKPSTDLAYVLCQRHVSAPSVHYGASSRCAAVSSAICLRARYPMPTTDVAHSADRRVPTRPLCDDLATAICLEFAMRSTERASISGLCGTCSEQPRGWRAGTCAYLGTSAGTDLGMDFLPAGVETELLQDNLNAFQEGLLEFEDEDEDEDEDADADADADEDEENEEEVRNEEMPVLGEAAMEGDDGPRPGRIEGDGRHALRSIQHASGAQAYAAYHDAVSRSDVCVCGDRG